MPDHEHNWIDDLVACKYRCALCGCEVSHELARQFAETSEIAITPAILSQLARTTGIVII